MYWHFGIPTPYHVPPPPFHSESTYQAHDIIGQVSCKISWHKTCKSWQGQPRVIHIHTTQILRGNKWADVTLHAWLYSTEHMFASVSVGAEPFHSQEWSDIIFSFSLSQELYLCQYVVSLGSIFVMWENLLKAHFGGLFQYRNSWNDQNNSPFSGLSWLQTCQNQLRVSLWRFYSHSGMRVAWERTLFGLLFHCQRQI